MTAVPERTDIFVVGGGPAGLAAAIAARSKGLHVVVADGAHPPIDKACGEGLMPDSFGALRRLGIQLDADQSFAFRGIRFLGEGASVQADFPSGAAIAMRRTRLHQALIARASEAGATILWGTRVSGLSPEGVTLDTGRVRCRWVIGADGQNSRVRRWAGLDRSRRESFRFGFRRHYELAPWTDYLEIHWGSGCQLYVTQVHQSEICVAMITSDPHLRLEHALPRFPELARRLAGARITTSERGGITASRSLRQVYRGRIILVGDASGSVDAITGEGLCLSFHQALALAEALACGDPVSYQTEHRRLARRPAFMAELMFLLDRHRWLRRRVLHGLASKPAIFANLLAMHVGSLSASDFVVNGMLPLGRRILWAS